MNSKSTSTQLLAALDSRDLAINAPFFHVLPRDGSKYASGYFGYAGPDVGLISPAGDE